MKHPDVIDALYSASTLPQLWSEVLCKVVDHVGATAGNIVFQAPDTAKSFLISGRMREDLNRLYLDHYAKNSYARAYAALPPGQVATGNRLVDVKKVRKSSFYADICIPQDIDNQLFLPHASLQQRGGIGGVALFLSARKSDDDAAAARKFDQLAPHISRAIDISLMASRVTSGAKLLARLLACMSEAAILINNRGHIVQTNKAAEDLLLKADGLLATSPSPSTLVAHHRGSSSELAASIHGALAAVRGEPVRFQGALRIIRPSARPPYLVVLTPLPPSSFSVWEAMDDGARVMVQIIDPQPKVDHRADRLRLLFALTSAEARVAALIGSGMQVAEIASILGVSVNTVKTHLRRCFDKTDVHSQVALVRLIASMPSDSSE